MQWIRNSGNMFNRSRKMYQENRRLIINLGKGWARICQFLNSPIPYCHIPLFFILYFNFFSISIILSLLLPFLLSIYHQYHQYRQYYSYYHTLLLVNFSTAISLLLINSHTQALPHMSEKAKCNETEMIYHQISVTNNLV